MKKPQTRKPPQTTPTRTRELKREELALAAGGDNPGMGPYDPPQTNGCVMTQMTTSGWEQCIATFT